MEQFKLNPVSKLALQSIVKPITSNKEPVSGRIEINKEKLSRYSNLSPLEKDRVFAALVMCLHFIYQKGGQSGLTLPQIKHYNEILSQNPPGTRQIDDEEKGIHHPVRYSRIGRNAGGRSKARQFIRC